MTAGMSKMLTLYCVEQTDKYSDWDAVEFVKAAPGARLRQALIDLAHGLVVHLVAAIEDIALHPQCASQILCGLGLARPCMAMFPH